MAPRGGKNPSLPGQHNRHSWGRPFPSRHAFPGAITGSHRCDSGFQHTRLKSFFHLSMSDQLEPAKQEWQQLLSIIYGESPVLGGERWDCLQAPEHTMPTAQEDAGVREPSPQHPPKSPKLLLEKQPLAEQSP